MIIEQRASERSGEQSKGLAKETRMCASDQAASAARRGHLGVAACLACRNQRAWRVEMAARKRLPALYENFSPADARRAAQALRGRAAGWEGSKCKIEQRMNANRRSLHRYVQFSSFCNWCARTHIARRKPPLRMISTARGGFGHLGRFREFALNRRVHFWQLCGAIFNPAGHEVGCRDMLE